MSQVIEQLLYWVTQENLIEFLLQSSLPYILLPMVHASYCAPYPKWPWVWHEASMRPACVVYAVWRHFVPEPSTSFSQVPWSVLWLCHHFVTDVTEWLINPNLSCSKNRKMKMKRENKIKSTVNNFDII